MGLKLLWIACLGDNLNNAGYHPGALLITFPHWGETTRCDVSMACHLWLMPSCPKASQKAPGVRRTAHVSGSALITVRLNGADCALY